MIQFERSSDYELIRSIMTHPRIYDKIADDSSPAPADYHPPEHEAIWYVMVRDAGELLGLWMFCPQNAVCWEVHTCLLPAAWGDRGQAAARLLPEWIWENTCCRRIITNVPTTNRLALHFALKAGMRMFGVNPRSYLKRGVLCDQIMLGISQPSREPTPVSIFRSEEEELCRQPQP